MEGIILKYRIKYFLQMAPDESSWATFMGQVEHSLDLPWPNLLQVKKIQIERKKHCYFLSNYSQATKTFCFCGKPAGNCLYTISQLIRTH